MGRSIALVLALLMGLLLAWREMRVGDPAPATAPPAYFSATRAMADVRLVARRPHPTGSPANQAVREALVGRMAALGLAARVRRDDVLFRVSDGRRLEGGSVETLIGVLPGRDRTSPPLAIMAHYDSVPGAPGAADDAAGVAAALEVVRALKAQGTPARDVALVITDGEEAGLLGARGFFAHEPLAPRLGFVLNLEARGSGGRVQMFQTGPENGGAIALFRRTAVRPSAGSLFGEVYARLPNDTDFTLARQAGLAGFNYAFAGRAFDYHSATDTPGNLQQGALQDMGDQVLAAASAVAFAAELPPRRPDAVYGVAPWGAVIAYAAPWGWLPLALSAVLIAMAGRAARTRGQLTLCEAGRGLAGAVFTLAGGLAVLHLAAVVTAPLGPQRLFADAPRWEAAQLALAAGFLTFAAAELARGRRWAAALLALGAGVAACAATTSFDALGLTAGAIAAAMAVVAGGAIGRPAAWGGVLGVGLVLAVAAQVAAPQTAYVLAWPLLAGAAAAASTRLGADLRPAKLVAATLLAALGLAFALVHAHLIVVATGYPELLTLPLLMAALVVWPLVQPAPGAPPEELAGAVLLLAGAALTAWIRLTTPWDARHPEPSHVVYQIDQDARRAWRVSRPDLRTDWSDAALRADGGAVRRLAHWAWPQPMAAAAARPVEAPSPGLTVTRRGADVAVTLVPTPGARAIALELAPPADATLARVGEAVADTPLPARRWTTLHWTAPPADGLTLLVRTSTRGELAVRYVQELDAWPQGARPLPPRPSHVMMTGRSGQTFVTGTLRTKW